MAQFDRAEYIFFHVVYVAYQQDGEFIPESLCIGKPENN
jgi:hypothetical protein